MELCENCGEEIWVCTCDKCEDCSSLDDIQDNDLCRKCNAEYEDYIDTVRTRN